MIAPRLLEKKEVEAQLKALGCEKQNECIEGHSCWVTPWGFYFMVIELPPDGVTPQWDFRLLLVEIENSKPTYQ